MTLPILLLLACTGGSSDTGATTDSGGDGGSGDGGGNAELGLEVVQSQAMPTVFTATWSGGGDSAFATISLAGESALSVEATATDDGWEAVLWGVPQDSQVEINAGIRTADGDQQESVTMQTGTLSGSYVTPVIDGEGDDGMLYLSQGELVWDIQVLDGDGRLVWGMEDDGENVAVMRVSPSRDGRAILYNRFPLLLASEDFATDAWIVRAPLDGSAPEERQIPWAHHDFYEHDDGTLALLLFDERDVDGRTVRGDRIIELSPDGTERELWNSWDSYPYDDAWVTRMGDAEYWPYANTLHYDEDAGEYTIGLKLADCIFRLDRETLDVAWEIGGPGSDWTFQGDGALFKEQHGHHVVGDELLVFDNREPSDGSSRAVSLQLDRDAKVVTQNWEYFADPPRFSLVAGDIMRLPNGNTAVVWSLLGMIEEVDSSGEVVRSLKYADGSMAYVSRSQGLPPQGP